MKNCFAELNLCDRKESSYDRSHIEPCGNRRIEMLANSRLGVKLFPANQERLPEIITVFLDFIWLTENKRTATGYLWNA